MNAPQGNRSDNRTTTPEITSLGWSFLMKSRKMPYFCPISRKIPTPTLSKLGWEHGAGNRNRTGTDFTPRDFKSLVSTYSTMPAGWLQYMVAYFFTSVKRKPIDPFPLFMPYTVSFRPFSAQKSTVPSFSKFVPEI